MCVCYSVVWCVPASLCSEFLRSSPLMCPPRLPVSPSPSGWPRAVACEWAATVVPVDVASMLWCDCVDGAFLLDPYAFTDGYLARLGVGKPARLRLMAAVARLRATCPPFV